MLPSRKQPVQAGATLYVSDGKFLQDKPELPLNGYLYYVNKGTLLESPNIDINSSYDKKNLYAIKEIYSNGTEKYRVKFDTIGQFQTGVSDPWGSSSISDQKEDFSKYKYVKKETFLSYVNYLTTRDKIHYINVNRSIH